MKYSNKKEFYVYLLLDPRKKGPFYYGHWKFPFEPFYVGKGKNKRAFSHLKDSNNVVVNRKIKNIRSVSLAPVVFIKQKNITEKQAYFLEKKLVLKIGRHNLKTGPLTNMSDGGDGIIGRVVTKKWKENKSKEVKKRFKSMTSKKRRERGRKISSGLRTAYLEGRRDAVKSGKKISKTKNKLGSFFERMTPRRRKEYSILRSKRSKRYQRSLTKKEKNLYREKMIEVNKLVSLSRKSTVFIKYSGIKLCVTHWASKILGISPDCIHRRIKQKIPFRQILKKFDPKGLKLKKYRGIA